MTPRCGNAVREAGEQCDGADDVTCHPGRCRVDCTCGPPAPTCGNGVIEGTEKCDGAAIGSCEVACAECACVPAVCGNAIVGGIEECDGTSDSACPGRCRDDCTCAPAPVCGDDVIDPGEECDGQAIGPCEVACDDGCVCVPPVCGNGLVAGDEECDGQNDYMCPTLCLADCTCPPPVCGNAVTEAGEDCEPGVTDSNCNRDACLPDCTCAVCGNEVIEAPFEICEPTDDAACPGLCSTQTCQCLSPTTDSCEAPRELVTFPAIDRQSTLGATIGSADPAFPCGPYGHPISHEGTVWYALTAPGTGRITADTAGSTFDTVLGAYTGTCDALTSVACNDDPQSSRQARIDFPVVAGSRYVVQAAAYGGYGGGDLVISVDFRPCGDGVLDAGDECEPSLPETCATGTCSPMCECLDVATDECAAAVVATELPIMLRLAAYQSTGAAGDPPLVCAPVQPAPAQSTWVRFVAPTDGIVDVTTNGSDYDTVLGVLTGECGALTLDGCNDDGGSDFQSFIQQPVSAGVVYTIVVKPFYADAAGELDLTVAYEQPE